MILYHKNIKFITRKLIVLYFQYFYFGSENKKKSVMNKDWRHMRDEKYRDCHEREKKKLQKLPRETCFCNGREDTNCKKMGFLAHYKVSYIAHYSISINLYLHIHTCICMYIYKY